jgi:Na+-transporting NADH:ubiquinone oxidoreductase subunit B
LKALEKIIHNLDPHFEKGGKWEKMYPLYETLSTFLFTPKHTTKKGAHIRDGVDLKRTMFMVIIALVPCLLFGIYNTGHWHYELQSFINPEYAGYDAYLTGFGDKVIYGLIQVLPLIIVSYAAGLAVEFVFAMLHGTHGLHEGFLVSGLLIPLTMPADVPLWMVAVATIFAVVIGKEVFGGTGMNILNVALTARAFLFFAYPTEMSGDQVWKSGTRDVIAQNGGLMPDGSSGATALGDLQSMVGDSPIIAGEAMSSAATSAELLEKFQAAYDPLHAFIGMVPGSVGETSALAALIGAAILIFTGVGSLRIIASFFAGGIAFGLLMNAFGANPYMDLPAYYHLIIGGFAFGAVYMATDPVTAAQTENGKLWYGFFAGGIAILIRVLNPAYPEGVMLSILFMNVMAPMIDHYVIQAHIKKRQKRFKTA